MADKDSQPQKVHARKEKKKAGPLARGYLVAYNAVNCLLWTAVLVIGILHLVEKKTYKGMYPKVRMPLLVGQTLALLEVVHSAVKLVNSPVATTAIQVCALQRIEMSSVER